MIKKIDNSTKLELLSFLREQPVLNIYGLSYSEGYPLDDKFYKAYKCDGGYIVVLDSIAFVYADINEEIYTFFDYSGINNVYSFSKLSGNYLTDKAVIMFLEGKLKENHTSVYNASDMETYALLCDSFEYMPSYDSFKNTRIEQRHYLGSYSANIFEGNKLISTATVGMQNSLSGLISCVATDIKCRGNGYASSVIASVSNRLVNADKIPVIISNEIKVIELYKKLGFKIASNLYISVKE